MGIQDVVYWIGIVFVWVVMTLWPFAHLVDAWYKYSVKYAKSVNALPSSVENIKVASGWIMGIFWSVFSVAYTLLAQWFYHGIWKQ